MALLGEEPTLRRLIRTGIDRLRKGGALLRTHARQSIIFVKAHPAWLRDSRVFWLTILGTFGAPLAVWIWAPQEHVFRWAGLGLQLAGITTVWWGIRETRKLFDHPGFWQQTQAWLRRRPRYGGRIIGTSTAILGAATLNARGNSWSSVDPDASLEQRLEVIEKNLKRTRDDLSRFQQATDENFGKRDAALEQEKGARAVADREIREKLQAAETGGCMSRPWARSGCWPE